MEQIDKLISLHRGDTIELNAFVEKTDNNITEIRIRVNDKNKDYNKKYNLQCGILEFNEDNFTIKANDYFGFIEFAGKIIKSDGDYLLEYEQKMFFVGTNDIKGIAKQVNNNGDKIKIIGCNQGNIDNAQLKNGAYLLEATSYVGVISLPSGFRIQINPKISRTALYYILCYLYDAKIHTFDKSKFPQGSFFLDMFALIYKSELEKIIQQGLFKKYISEEDNQNFLKGKLLIDKQIKYNFINKHRFYCKYDDLTYDNLENQTILYSLTILSELVFDNRLKQELVDLRWILENEVTPRSYLKIEDVDKLTFSRLNDYYEKIIYLSKQIIREIYVGDIDAREIEAYGYLIDMNLIFEKFILLLVKNTLSEYSVKGQGVGINNLIKPIGNAPNVRIKPDMLISKNKNVKLIIDTKYKKISSKIAKATPADIYQIVSYSLAYKCNSMLIYPCDEKKVRFHYKFSDELDDVDWNIFVITVDISCEGELSKSDYSEFIKKIKKELCIEFDNYLVIPCDTIVN